MSISSKRFPPVILSTCLAPWTESYDFDEALFRAQVRRLRSELTEHLYLFGTAGEGYAMTDRMFALITGVFRQEMPDAANAMVGVIHLSLATMIERIGTAYDLGFRQFQLSLPSWGALTDAEVDVFFRETCDRFPDCQFLHYNLLHTKRLLTGADYARLSAKHANLVAVKMGGEDLAAMTEILRRAPAIQCFFTEFAYARLRDEHECGLLLALSAINFRQAKAFFFARGSQLSQRCAELRSIHSALKAAMANDAHMDGAYDKIYVKLHDPHFPLRLLPPYAGASERAFAAFRDALPQAWRPQ
jgi:hypothetical protein